jgi:hypothetical protein
LAWLEVLEQFVEVFLLPVLEVELLFSNLMLQFGDVRVVFGYA